LHEVVDVHRSQESIWPELLMEARIKQHGPDQVVKALDHPLSMTILLVDVWC
jgi:hypothetical protein